MTYTRRELEQKAIDPKAIGCRIVRRRLRLTQGEMAILLGVAKCTLARYELEPHRVSKRLALRIGAMCELWKMKPPTLVKKPERRGGWNRGQKAANDNTLGGGHVHDQGAESARSA